MSELEMSDLERQPEMTNDRQVETSFVCDEQLNEGDIVLMVVGEKIEGENRNKIRLTKFEYDLAEIIHLYTKKFTQSFCKHMAEAVEKMRSELKTSEEAIKNERTR